MFKNKPQQGLVGFFILMLITLACGISFNLDGGQDEGASIEQTLQALYASQTSEALSHAASMPTAEETATIPPQIEHALIPGNPGTAEVTHDEIDTSNTASQKLALGDSFRLGIFERPFSENIMDYFSEDDLIKVKISKDDNFYYMVLEMVGPNEDSGILSATYGVEFDTDYDGRGDVLLFAQGGGSTDWSIEGVAVYADSNNDVGGIRPVVPDGHTGDGYDQVLFSINDLNDPDGAWQKAEGNCVYLAVKSSLVGNNRFFWRAWADSGLADASKFDYNDAFSEEQAGSPVKTNDFYPIGQLNQMDSTCWIAYNLEPSGTKLGGCYQATPQPTTPPPTKPTKPSCPPCGNCEGLSYECCIKCSGCMWYEGHCVQKLI